MRRYQEKYYEQCMDLRNTTTRLKQADKILYVLTKFCGFPNLSSLALDIGCADGTITLSLSRIFRHIVGLDYDALALRHAEIKPNLTASFTQGDGMYLPFKDGTFDAIICAQVYEHVPDDELLFYEIQRILKPNGIVFFSGPNLLFPIEPHYKLPFLHWIPSRIADRYLQLLKRGDHYYEKSRTIWGLRRILQDFIIKDVNAEILKRMARRRYPNFLGGLINMIPTFILRILSPIFPNFNWILSKPQRKQN